MKKVKFYLPHMVVFITSMGIMIIELVASRMVSKYFGNSLYTWTAIIGVVLGGISLGNFIGGRIAERFDPSKSSTVLLLSSSASIFLILLLDYILGGIMSAAQSGGIVSTSMLLQSVLWIILLFFLPSTALGTISPVMATFALKRSEKMGNTVGSIYAVSAIGSIVGTFLAGYLLIPFLGLQFIIVTIGLIVAALSIVTGSFRIVSLAGTASILLMAVLSSGTVYSKEYPKDEGEYRVLYETDTQYSHIQVRDVPKAAGTERQLVMDMLIHNRYDRDEPLNLLYEYEVIFASLSDWFIENDSTSGKPRQDISALTIGGGAMIFPQYLEDVYGSRANHVVEIDPEVVRIAHRYFDIPRDGGIDIFTMDGRAFTQQAKGIYSYDLAYLDAFNAYAVPSHLSTKEYLMELKSLLGENGIILANCIDVFSIGRFLNALWNTFNASFEHTAVYARSAGNLNGRQTYVIAASDTAEFPKRLLDETDNLIAERLGEERHTELREKNGTLILRDNHAPVDNLMAPVFTHSLK